MHLVKELEQYTDSDIIQKILMGEVAMYEVIIRRYNRYLYKTGRAYGYSHADTEDLMQETYLSVYTNLSKFEGRSSFKTWVVRIMLNHCYQKKQKFSFQKETRMEEGLPENSTPMFSNYPDTGKVIMNKELSRVLESALLRLSEEYRMVFSLRELNGLSVQETAEVLSITPANVKVRLNRARHMMRAEIEKMYTPEDIFEFNLVYCDGMVERVMTAIRSI